jgi:glycerophosphoryl diester phosphodiesterase
MLRRRKSDPPFLRANLVAALRAKAACEVDIVFTADGHGICLHDRTLDRETTGAGRISDTERAVIERLRLRGPGGEVRDEPPLFLDEVAGAVAAGGVTTPALVQLDIKTRARDLTAVAMQRFGAALGQCTGAFIASAYEWETVQRLVEAAPGLHAGFDPLAFYPRSLALDADGFRAIAERTLIVAPDAAIYYLEARLILAALGKGIDLIAAITRHGAQVDAWTIDADHPDLSKVITTLIDLGCHQITSNDPDQLAAVIGELAPC